MGVRVTFVGGPTAVLEVEGLRLLTDPTFSPVGMHESAPGRPLTKTEGPALDVDGSAGSMPCCCLTTSMPTTSTQLARR